MKTLSESVHCYIDGASGIYIPKRFARETKRECIHGVSEADLDYLARGPGGCLDDDKELTQGETIRGEFYWDIWADVLENAIVQEPDSEISFKLHQDDSLFLVPKDWEWNQYSVGWERPESDTLGRYVLPANWASYLINGDASGLEDLERKECDQWLEGEYLKGWSCTADGHYFAHSHDASTLACYVSRYTFIKH